MGAVTRNSSKEAVAAMARKGPGAACTEITEACCLRKVLQWACALSFEKVIKKFDCTILVTASNSHVSALNSNLGIVLLDCNLLMASFIDCRIQYVVGRVT
ncbi:hypothetical protein SLE2022_293500 [Rubroshorea leprosula]